MDILSHKTLTILRDENVSKAVDELLDRGTTGSSRTVELTTKAERGSGDVRLPRIRIRRIA